MGQIGRLGHDIRYIQRDIPEGEGCAEKRKVGRLATQRERIELMRQGIVRGAIIPRLEADGYMVSAWKRPVSLEDMELRDEGWVPYFTQYTSWETYIREEPLHIYFNTFYGDVYERAYRHCFVEYLLPIRSSRIPLELIGTFSRLNLRDGGHIWKHRIMVDISDPDAAVAEIEKVYDELLLALIEAGLVKVVEDRQRKR
jgi:hypothetical protein